MFKTLVMVCMLTQPNQCVFFEDTTGLKTEEGCEARAAEMAEVILPYFMVPMTAHFKCEKQTGV